MADLKSGWSKFVIADILSALIVGCGKEAIEVASSIAELRACPVGTTLLARPILNASSPVEGKRKEERGEEEGNGMSTN
jgi:hypothetical protein